MNKTVAEQALSDVIQMDSGPGQMLAEARARLGLSQQEVADKLHLRLQSVMSIEKDELEENVSFTFSKGYVRLYSKLVNLDEKVVLDAFNLLHNQGELPSSLKMQSFSRRVEREAHDSRWNLFTYVVIFFVLASLGYWWYDTHGKDGVDFLNGQTDAADTNSRELGSQGNQLTPDTSERQITSARTLIAEDEGGSTSSPTEMSAEALAKMEDDLQKALQPSPDEADEGDTAFTVEENTEAALANVLSDTPEDTVAASVETAQETAPASSDRSQWFANDNESIGTPSTNTQSEQDTASSQISRVAPSRSAVDMTFTFTEDCWLSVTDATDDAIAYGIKTKGYVMNIRGVPPITVNLCPPERVQIAYNGNPVSLERFDPKNSIVLTLPLTGN